MFQTKLYCKTFLFAMAFLFSGCVYPAYKTIQAESTIYVADEKGSPIDDAKVYLFSNKEKSCKKKINSLR